MFFDLNGIDDSFNLYYAEGDEGAAAAGGAPASAVEEADETGKGKGAAEGGVPDEAAKADEGTPAEAGAQAEEPPAWAKELKADVQGLKQRLSEAAEEEEYYDEAGDEDAEDDKFLKLVYEKDNLSGKDLGRLQQIATKRRQRETRKGSLEKMQTETREGMAAAAEELKPDFPDIIDKDGNLGQKYSDALVELYGHADPKTGKWDVMPASAQERMKAAIYYRFGKPGTKPIPKPPKTPAAGDEKARLETPGTGDSTGIPFAPESAKTDEELKKQIAAEIARKEKSKGG